MNDFTKEELEGLLLCMVHSSWIYKANKSILQEKIKSMIENYCEHEPHGDFHVCVDKCKKCGVIINV
jgi:hypothetical protein